MATIQERLDRMKQDGLQQRLDRMKQDGQRLKQATESGGGGTDVSSVLPVPGQSVGTSFRRILDSGPSLAPLPAAKPSRTSKDIQADMDSTDGVIRELREKQRTLSAQAQQLANRGNTWNHRGGAGTGRQWSQQAEALRSQAKELE